MLVSDLITLSFLDLGVIAPGETITTAMQTDAFTRLLALMASLSAEGLTIPNQVEQTFNLLAGVDSYTLGATGIWVTTGGLRAMKVTSWRASFGALRRGGAPVRMDDFAAAAAAAQERLSEEYRRALMAGVITLFPATLTTPVPEVVGADTNYPNLNVRISPAPSGTPGTIELGYWTELTSFATVGDTVNMPQGWVDLLHFQLALRLYPQYARAGGVDPGLLANAQQAKAAITQENAMPGLQPPAQQQG